MISRCLLLLTLLLNCTAVASADDEHVLHSFSRQQLSDVYYSEGISVGDLNNDGHKDVVCGPHWYSGQRLHAHKPHVGLWRCLDSQ